MDRNANKFDYNIISNRTSELDEKYNKLNEGASLKD